MAKPIGNPAVAASRENPETTEEILALLSPRELEVATLVTLGLSDRKISMKLGISRRTAESHVAHILSKLGFSSRVQVAAHMTRCFRAPTGADPIRYDANLARLHRI
jgi:non-specific serine/threonine protein kinase